jgi:putative hydrolase of HD superfamily
MMEEVVNMSKELTKDRLEKQMKFLLEVDKAKNIFRRNYLVDGSRKENDAEHSWHLALMVMLLSEYVEKKDFDVLKTMKMVLIHDLVEIYAGDVYCYDDKANVGKLEREMEAADKLFGLLPEEQREEFQSLWLEFEDKATEEALFAAKLDRLQPLALNYASEGKSWIEHDIEGSKVKERNRLFDGGPRLMKDYVDNMIDDAMDKGYLK